MPLTLAIPELFSNLLQGCEFAGPVSDCVHKVSTILSDNTLPFFPNYTDHGVQHVGRVSAIRRPRGAEASWTRHRHAAEGWGSLPHSI